MAAIESLVVIILLRGVKFKYYGTLIYITGFHTGFFSLLNTQILSNKNMVLTVV